MVTSASRFSLTACLSLFGALASLAQAAPTSKYDPASAPATASAPGASNTAMDYATRGNIRLGSPRLMEGPTWPQGLQIQNLDQAQALTGASFEWDLLDFPAPFAPGNPSADLEKSSQAIPDIAPGATLAYRLTLPGNWSEHHALRLRLRSAKGELLGAWSWALKPHTSLVREGLRHTQVDPSGVVRNGTFYALASGSTWCWDEKSGALAAIVAMHTQLQLDKDAALLCQMPAGPEDHSPAPIPMHLEVSAKHRTARGLELEQDFSGEKAFLHLVWILDGSPIVSLEYEYSLPAPRAALRLRLVTQPACSLRWLGFGPGGTWTETSAGEELGLWSAQVNTGDKGLNLRDWQWLELGFRQGRLSLGNSSGVRNLCLLPATASLAGPVPGAGTVLQAKAPVKETPAFDLFLLDAGEAPAPGIADSSSGEPPMITHKGSLQLRFTPAQ